MNKKGISAVVATILIVLLAVVAVTIVWQVIKPALRETAGSVSTNCIEVDISLDKVDCTNQQVTITLNKGAISGLKVVLYNDTGSKVTTISSGILEELETKTYTGDSPGGNVSGANVAAVINSTTGQGQTCSFVLTTPKPCA